LFFVAVSECLIAMLSVVCSSVLCIALVQLVWFE